MTDNAKLKELSPLLSAEIEKQNNRGISTMAAAISFIRKNLSPDEVFDKKELLIFLEDEQKQGRLENKLPKQENY